MSSNIILSLSLSLLLIAHQVVTTRMGFSRPGFLLTVNLVTGWLKPVRRYSGKEAAFVPSGDMSEHIMVHL